MTNILELEELIHETIAANITVTKYHDMYIYSCTDDISPFYIGEGKTREEALSDMYNNIKNHKDADTIGVCYKIEGQGIIIN